MVAFAARTLLFALLLSFRTNASAAEVRSLDVKIPVAPTPVMVDGHWQLVYELQVTSRAPADLSLLRLNILGAGTAPIASIAGKALANRFGLSTGKGKPDEATLAFGAKGIIYIELSLRADAELPQSLRHVLSYDDGGRSWTVLSDVSLATRDAIVIGPPLRGGPWIGIYDPAMTRGHRRVLIATDGSDRIPARFAIDWVRLDNEAHMSRGDDAVVANYLGYGEDVLAVADATVAATRDSIPESARLSDEHHALEDASGNYVTLDLGGDRYASYEHLKPGSVRVHPGDKVRRGQVIGSLGYTGDSTGPHLHFHVSTGPTPLAGEGIPFAIDHFEVLGGYASLALFGDGKRWAPLAPNSARKREKEMPAANAVVQF